MFSKKHRLNSRIFTRLKKTGTRIFTPYFQGTYNKQDNFAISVVIPKKRIGKRVLRNREKRRILSIIKNRIAKPLPNSSIIISLQKDTQSLSPDLLYKELENFFNKIK